MKVGVYPAKVSVKADQAAVLTSAGES
jgi:hypothetical protein